MKTEKFKGHVDAAYGKDLPRPGVDFSGTYEAVERIDEIPDDEKLGPADIIDVVNNKRKSAARAKATAEALQAAGVEKPDPNSPEVIQENFLKATMKQYGCDLDTAKRIMDAARQAVAATA